MRFSTHRKFVLYTLAIVLCFAAFAPQSLGVSVSKQEQQADDYFLGRQNLSNVWKGLQLLEGAISANPADYEAWWRIAEFYCHLARHAPSEKQQMNYLNHGITAAKRAVALQPNRVEGHFWLGTNMGIMAEEGSLWEAFKLIDQVRRELETAARIDPDYKEAAPVRNLGRFYYEVPFFKGGDKQRSARLLEECLRKYPDDSFALLFLSDTYRALGRLAEARAQLEKMLKLCPDPGYGPELADNQQIARSKLATEFHASNIAPLPACVVQ